MSMAPATKKHALLACHVACFPFLILTTACSSNSVAPMPSISISSVPVSISQSSSPDSFVRDVTPGTFCDRVGAEGITKTGRQMRCSVPGMTDGRSRWRSI